MEGIDLNRSYCNEINTINKYFGIEAARSAFLKEFNLVFSDHNVNKHHLSILVDVITNKGKFVSIDRHGINRSDVGPLAKCSFEETTDMLVNASIFSE